MPEKSSIAEGLLASEEGLCSMELVTHGALNQAGYDGPLR